MIRGLRGDASDVPDKQRVLEDVIANPDEAVAKAETLLRSVDDLLLTQTLLDAQERGERLRQLVSVVVVDRTGAYATTF